MGKKQKEDKKNKKEENAEEKENKKKKKEAGDKKKKDKEDQKKKNQNKKDEHKNKKDEKRAEAVVKKEAKSFEKSADFECEGEPEVYPWFQNRGHWECQVGNKGKVCAYVCNYNVSKQTVIFCENGTWGDSRWAHEKCL